MSARRRGWEMAFMAEVEPFPAAVLMERFGATRPLRPLDPEAAPDEKTRKQWENWAKKIASMPESGTVPNLGDFTLINEDDYDGTIDLLAGGTPCQDFSIAGLRKGLDGERGNLSLEFAKLAYRSSARWLLWENVPGVFSSNSGNDFAAFLSCVTGWEITVPADGWNNSGIVSGAPGCYGVAWRVLDVQYTRVPNSFEYAIPQRRRRVFVIGYLGDWRPAAAVLFERECLQWHSPPRREAGTGVARSFTASTGGASAKEQQHTFIGDGNRPLNELKTARMQSFGDYEIDGIASTMKNRDHKDATDLVIACHESGPGYWNESDHAGSIKTNGAEASQVVCYDNQTRARDPQAVGNMSPTLQAHCGTGGGNLPLLCKSIRMRSGCAGGGKGALIGDNISHTLKNINDQSVIAFKAGQGAKAGSIAACNDFSPTLGAADSGSNRTPSLMNVSTVRRLIPLECERLMGFPDNHTLIPWNGKPASECPDSPRYKACGNSMGNNVIEWLFIRIEMVIEILSTTENTESTEKN